MRTKTIQIILLMILVLSGMALPASAETIDWSEDFGQGNFDEWYVHSGSFNIQNHSLFSTNESMISRPSTRSNGTWLFDVYENSTNGDWFEFMFCLYGLEPSYILWGYYIDVDHNFQNIKIFRRDVSPYFFGDSYSFLLAQYNFPDGYETLGWTSYNVTRTRDGDIIVTRQGELIINVLFNDTETELFGNKLNTSGYVGIHVSKGVGFDNIVVGEDISLSTETGTGTTDTTIPTTPPQIWDTDNPPYTPTFVLMLSVAVGIGILAFVIVIVKRR